MKPLIRASNLFHSFENILYENINLEVCRGESIAILGVSGSGKSTLLNNLSTLLPPQKGLVGLLDNDDIYSLSSKDLLLLRRLDIGIVFQAHYLFRGFSVEENLKVASILTGEALDEKLLESFGLARLIHQPIGQLSGGQQQRLSIARVLTKKPKIIFADEPTGNLDKQTALFVMEVLLKYIHEHQAALVLVTHDYDVASLCDKIYTLSDRTLSKTSSV